MLYKDMVKMRHGIKFVKSAIKKVQDPLGKQTLEEIAKWLESGAKRYKKGKRLSVLEKDYVKVFCKVDCEK